MRVLAVRHFDETCYCEWLVEGKPKRAFFLVADLTHISFITRLQARPQARTPPVVTPSISPITERKHNRNASGSRQDPLTGVAAGAGRGGNRVPGVRSAGASESWG